MRCKQKKLGPSVKTRQKKRVRDCLVFGSQCAAEQTTKRAKEGLLWFMRESAYQYMKLMKFKSMIGTVIRVQ